MNPKPRIGLMVVVGVLAATSWTVAQSKDPFVGSWTLNVAKSKYNPGPAPKSQTSTYEAAGKGYKISVRSTPATGAAQEWSYATNLDGKPAPIIGINPNADMVTTKRVDALTLEVVYMKNGKETTRQRNVVAADGKTRTVTTTGVDVTGQKVNNVAVYEKK
jgi:hypothetical protein